MIDPFITILIYKSMVIEGLSIGMENEHARETIAGLILDLNISAVSSDPPAKIETEKQATRGKRILLHTQMKNSNNLGTSNKEVEVTLRITNLTWF